MSGRVVLHIGAMKTGTSFVQSVLLKHAEQLEAAGAGYLGTFRQQMRSVQDALRSPGDLAAWHRLLGLVRDDCTNIISMEFLSFAKPPQIEALLEPLRGREVQVVLTARDQLRVLPAQWQSHTRNFGSASWGAYLREVCTSRRPARPGHAYRTYHRAQDLVEIVDRWAGAAGVHRFDVVTVPRPGAPREELWLRFCRALGLSVDDVQLASVTENPSIGYASCDVLRRLNEHLVEKPTGGVRQRLTPGARLSPGRAAAQRLPGYRSLIREIVDHGLAPLRNEETKPVLDRDAAHYAVARNREVVDLLARSGIGCVGSIDDDLPTELPAAGFPATVAPPPQEHVLRAAQAVWDHVALTTGARAGRPTGLDELTADAARMLLSRSAESGS
ncbi:MAG: hypothetical protein QOH89_3459 [Pseudonocardiales bacterium]|nr:hypothetical protein [Pseudonocardiales bacterium]